MGENLAKFTESFRDESDRGAILISAALLDECLRSLITVYMVDDKKEVDELLGSEKLYDRPLGTFGARIRTAYCLGLISRDEFDDLRIIQKIRNEFAHKIDTSSFNNTRIKEQCSSLNIPQRKPILKTWSPREQFLFTVGALEILLDARTRKAKPERRKVPSESQAV